MSKENREKKEKSLSPSKWNTPGFIKRIKKIVTRDLIEVQAHNDSFESFSSLNSVTSEQIIDFKRILNYMRLKTEVIEKAKKNDSSEIKDYCSSLKTELESALKKKIDNIHHRYNDLINKVDKYEALCLENLSSNKIYKYELESILENLKIFQSQWNERLKEKKLKRNDYEDGIGRSDLLMDYISYAEKLLDKYLSRDAFLEFSENKKEISSPSFIGTIYLKSPPKDLVKKLQLNKSMFKDYEPLCGILEIQDFKNGNYIICYKDSEHGLECHLIDNEGQSIKKYIFIGLCERFNFNISANYAFIYFHSKETNCYHKIKVFDKNLELKKFITINEGYSFTSSNSFGLYCLNMERTKINVYDDELIIYKEINLNKIQPGCGLKKIINIKIYQNNFYILDEDFYLEIIDAYIGKSHNRFKIAGKIFINLRDKIAVLDENNNQIVYYDLKGMRLEDQQFENFLAKNVFLMEFNKSIFYNYDNDFSFFDLQDFAIYSIPSTFF